MKKRVSSLILAVVMLLLLVMPGVSAANYENSLHVITSLGYAEANTEDHPITRGEASDMLVKLMELGYTADGDTALPFGDVAASHPYYQAIASALQLGMLSHDTEFRPDDGIIYSEMAKMIVCLLGHAEDAEELGAYPAGYNLLAQRLGIFEGVTGGADDVVTSHEAVIMLYNTFCATVKEPVRFTAADGSVVFNQSRKLYQYLGYELASGIVVANDMTTLNTTESSLPDGTVAIGTLDRVFDAGGTDIEDYLGQDVHAFYKKNESDRGEIKTFFAAPETRVLTLGYKDSPVAYMEGERIAIDYFKENGKMANTITLAQRIIYNGVSTGVATNESLNAIFDDFKGATLTLISNNGGTAYDVIKVDRPVTGVVTRVDVNNNTVYYKDYAIAGHEMALILDKEAEIAVYTPDGKLSALANISPGVVVSVYADQAMKHVKILTCTTVAEGTITRKTTDGEYYIDDTLYEKVEALPESFMELGLRTKFYLNAEGFIVGLETGSVNYNYYGFLMNATDTYDPQIQVLTASGELVTLECEDEIYAFDGTAVNKVDFSSLICTTPVDKGYGNVPKHMLWYTNNANNFTYDTNTSSSTTRFYWRPGLSEADKSNAASRKPIYYELNDKGKVRKIIVPDIGGEDNKITSMNDVDGTLRWHWAPRSTNLSISSNAGATTLQVSPNAIAYNCLALTYDVEDYKYAGAYSYFTNGTGRKFQLYSVENSGKVDIMIGYNFLPYENVNNMPLVVVKSVGQGLDDTYEIEGMSAGSEYLATVDGDLSVIERDLQVEKSGAYEPLTASNILDAANGSRVKDAALENNKRQTVADAKLKNGDIIMLGKDRNENVSYIEVVMRGDRGVNLATSVGSSYTSRLSSSHQIEKGVVTAYTDGQCYVRVVNEYNSKLRRNTVYSDPAVVTPFYDETQLVRFSYSGCKIMEMDYATGEIWQADYTSLKVGDVVLYKGPAYSPTSCIILRNNPIEPDYYEYWYQPGDDQPGEDNPDVPVRPAEYEIDNKNNYAGFGLTSAWPSTGMVRYATGTGNGVYVKVPFSALKYNGTLDNIESIKLTISFNAAAASKAAKMGLFAATETEMNGTWGTNTALSMPAATTPLLTFDVPAMSSETVPVELDITEIAKANLCDNTDLYLFLGRTEDNQDKNLRMYCYSGTGKSGVPMKLTMTYKE